MVGKPQANWGLHLVDVNLAMGNLRRDRGSTIQGVFVEEIDVEAGLQIGRGAA